MGSITNIDQHKFLFPVVPSTIDFARETYSSFTPDACIPRRSVTQKMDKNQL